MAASAAHLPLDRATLCPSPTAWGRTELDGPPDRWPEQPEYLSRYSVVDLRVGGKDPRAHVGGVGGDRRRGLLPQFGIAAHEPGRGRVDPQQIVQDEDLPVAGRSGPDADGGHVERLGDRRPHRRGHPFDAVSYTHLTLP